VLFAAAMYRLQSQWTSLTTPAARATALVAAVASSFRAAGVPVPTSVVRSDLPATTRGSFGFATWVINLNQTLLAAASLTDAEADQVAQTLFHEAQHCEQWFRMARYRAGKGDSASKIASSMGIPATIAAAAKAAPMTGKGSDVATAEVLWNSVYGTNAQHRNTTYKQMDAANAAYVQAVATYKANPTDPNKRAMQAAYNATTAPFRAYLALPEEVAARASGDAAVAALDRYRNLMRLIDELKAEGRGPRDTDGAGDFPTQSGDQNLGVG